MADLFHTDFTETVHRTEYPAISPTRPELNQAGRGVLITGGGTGIGKSIAQHFLRASTGLIVIIGRRADVLEKAVAELEQEAKEIAGSPCKVFARRCDVTSESEVKALWDELAEKKLLIDVLVLNAAKFTTPAPLLELGAEEIWAQMEVNVKGSILFTERFMQQNQGKQKVSNLHIPYMRFSSTPTQTSLTECAISFSST
jgi:NAD(P)-dependent dehydrogenase (short-subunit alcohol dehydrogenase family)